MNSGHNHWILLCCSGHTIHHSHYRIATVLCLLSKATTGIMIYCYNHWLPVSSRGDALLQTWGYRLVWNCKAGLARKYPYSHSYFHPCHVVTVTGLSMTQHGSRAYNLHTLLKKHWIHNAVLEQSICCYRDKLVYFFLSVLFFVANIKSEKQNRAGG